MLDINQIMNFFGGMQGLQNKAQTLAGNLNRMNMNPQQMVQQMLNDGRMSQEQFNELREAANKITGKNL
jgi:hypothetical protein